MSDWKANGYLYAASHLDSGPVMVDQKLNKTGGKSSAIRGSWTLRLAPRLPLKTSTELRSPAMTANEIVETAREEMELEHLVEVLGDDDAQCAAERHTLPGLVYDVQQRKAA